jgi:hypothetical protein
MNITVIIILIFEITVTTTTKTVTTTNFYECLDFEDKNNFNLIPEHKCPWRSKQKWEKIATLHGKFNKLILFDGSKFFHGADISTDEYTKKYRMNQVIFFQL